MGAGGHARTARSSSAAAETRTAGWRLELEEEARATGREGGRQAGRHLTHPPVRWMDRSAAPHARTAGEEGGPGGARVLFTVG